MRQTMDETRYTVDVRPTRYKDVPIHGNFTTNLTPPQLIFVKLPNTWAKGVKSGGYYFFADTKLVYPVEFVKPQG